MTLAPRARNRFVAACAVLVAGLSLGWQLLVPPVIGLANNGDFERVMGHVGFEYLTADRAEKYFSWIQTKFAYGPPGRFGSGLLTSETLIAWAARLVSEPFAAGGYFDIRVLGAIHVLLLVTGIGLLISATASLPRAAQWVGAALLVFLFTDVGYAAPLNSFFSQAASLPFLLLTLGLLARWISRPGESRRLEIAYFVLAALFVCSKPQEALQGPFLAAFALRVGGSRDRGEVWKRGSVWGAACLCALSVWYFRQTPPEIADVARYHKVFMELLPHSPSPEQDLGDLGLDPSWTRAIGKIAYPPTSPYNDPEFRSAFLARFSYPRLVRFYLTHPGRLSDTVRRGGLEALRLRHPRFGNYERAAGFPPGARTRSFALWSDLRVSLPGHPLIWIASLFAANLAAVAATYRRASAVGRLAREGIVLLLLMATTAFSICVLANAHADLARHFYVFHALCDLVLIADVVWIADRLSQRSALAHARAPLVAPQS